MSVADLLVPEGVDRCTYAHRLVYFLSRTHVERGVGRGFDWEQNGVGAADVVAVTAGSEEKCAVIRELGAEAINHHDQANQVIAEKTTGNGINVILDILGGSYLNKNVAALAMEDRLVVLGFLGGAHVPDVDLLAIMDKRAIVTGSPLSEWVWRTFRRRNHQRKPRNKVVTNVGVVSSDIPTRFKVPN